MSKENLERFCELVLSDSGLQKQLKTLVERDEFIEKVIELGARSGFDFSREDVRLQMRENRRLWNERWI
jgi:predicted ribosomally synthesized peptide with nif11-like leader